MRTFQNTTRHKNCAMNPAMANWTDTELQQSISQMNFIANNPDMVNMMIEHAMKMDPGQLRKVQDIATSGNMDMGGWVVWEREQGMQGPEMLQLVEWGNATCPMGILKLPPYPH